MHLIQKISIIARGIQDCGPTKILIDENVIVNPKKTDIKPDIIFIRIDGWSLGVPNNLIEKAAELHDWVALLRSPFNKLELLKEHKIK